MRPSLSIAFLATLMAVGVLGGCGGETTPTPPPTAAAPTAAAPTADTSPLEAPVSPLEAPASPLALPEEYTPADGKSAVTGRLIDFTTGNPMAFQNLSLPAVLCAPGVAEEDKREQCFYMIDEAFDPSTLTDPNGDFIFKDIPAGEYVMFVGSLMTENAVLKEASKKHMPYQKIEDLENAKAMLILANEELKALGLYLDQARSDPRGKK